jgi:hypothetical protein
MSSRQAISIGQRRKRKLRYSLGYAWAHQEVAISYGPDTRQFLFKQIRTESRKWKAQSEIEPVRSDAISSRCFYGKNQSVEDITGLSRALKDLPTCQWMLPFAMCHLLLEGIAQGYAFLLYSKGCEIIIDNNRRPGCAGG